jgi:TPP-dependent pyruvate/acetoin dehydrogenase alpha subunit
MKAESQMQVKKTFDIKKTDKKTLAKWYSLMVLGRMLDERAANYLKQGKKPRVFIRIPSASLFLGTKTTGVYADSIADFDVIVRA